MKQTNLSPHRPTATRRHAGHAQEDHILDPNQRQQKPSDPAVCPQCGAPPWPKAARSARGGGLLPLAHGIDLAQCEKRRSVVCC
jgi:hypothetical protein